MKRNTLGDLNGYLFEQLETLSNPDLTGDELKEEIQRSKAITNIAKEVINNASVVLQANKFSVEYMKDAPELLEG